MRRLVRLSVAAALLGILLGLFGMAGSAYAEGETGTSAGSSATVLAGPGNANDVTTVSSTGACGMSSALAFVGSNKSDATGLSPNDYLTVNRWGGATGNLHTRLSANPLSDLSAKVNRNFIQGFALSAGNALWQGSTNMVGFANRMCLFDSLGGIADSYAGTIGKALVDGGAVTVALIVSVGALLWRAAKQGGGGWAPIGKKLLTLGIFAVLLAGASNTKVYGSDGKVYGAGDPVPGNVSVTNTTFGFGSPGWIAQKTDQVLSVAAGAPANAVAVTASSMSGLSDAGDENTLSCRRYVAQLQKDYAQAIAENSAAASDLTAEQSALKSGSGLPLVLDAMWQNSGLQAYINIQYGSQNPYGAQVFCRMLEAQAGIPYRDGTSAQGSTGTSVMGIMKAAGAEVPMLGVSDETGKSEALVFNPSNRQGDHTMVFWAACFVGEDNPTAWHMDPYWAKAKEMSQDDGDKACGNYWERNADKGNDGDKFNWEDDPNDIFEGVLQAGDATPNGNMTAGSGPQQIGNYLLNLHGDANGNASTIAIIFALSSLAVFAVFMLLAIAVIAAKIMIILMIVLSFLVLLIDLLPGADTSSRAGRYLKNGAGMMLFASGIQLILAIVAVLTGFMVAVGTQFGPGSIVSMIWTGIAPLLAILVVHWTFKHILKAPSPFAPGGGLAWGAAGAGLGAIAGAKLNSFKDRQQNRLQRRSQATMYAKRTAAAGAKQSRRTNPQSMAPLGAGGAAGGPGGSAVTGSASGAPAGTPAAAPLSPREQRLADSRAARQQRADSRAERSARIGTALSGSPREVAGNVGRAAGSGINRRMQSAVEGFRAKPMGSKLKTAGIVGAAMLAPVAAPVALGALAAGYGIKKSRSAVRERPIRRMERNQHQMQLAQWRQSAPEARRANGRRLEEQAHHASERARQELEDAMGPPPDIDHNYDEYMDPGE